MAGRTGINGVRILMRQFSSPLPFDFVLLRSELYGHFYTERLSYYGTYKYLQYSKKGGKKGKASTLSGFGSTLPSYLSQLEFFLGSPRVLGGSAVRIRYDPVHA
jgi:hypothetical protein